MSSYSWYWTKQGGTHWNYTGGVVHLTQDGEGNKGRARSRLGKENFSILEAEGETGQGYAKG